MIKHLEIKSCGMIRWNNSDFTGTQVSNQSHDQVWSKGCCATEYLIRWLRLKSEGGIYSCITCLWERRPGGANPSPDQTTPNVLQIKVLPWSQIGGYWFHQGYDSTQWFYVISALVVYIVSSLPHCIRWMLILQEDSSTLWLVLFLLLLDV